MPDPRGAFQALRGYRSLKVIENDTIRKLGYVFLFEFHSNYGPILYHFRSKARYRSKIAIFSYIIPPPFDAPLGGPRWNIAITFGMEN